MALVAPLFLLLLTGIIEFGQGFQIKHTLSEAARRGARAAVVDGATTSQITTKVKTYCTGALKVSASDVTVAVTVNGSTATDVSAAAKGAEINVKVSVAFSKAGAGFYASMLSSTILASNCTLEHE